MNLDLKDEDEPTAPFVIDGKNMTTVAEYASVEIKVLVKANPKAKVQWSRQNKLIRDNDTFTIREDESFHILTINKVSMVHKGEYKVCASNIHGTCDHIINLNVLGNS